MKLEGHARRLRHGVGLLLLLVASVSASLGVVELLLRRNVIPNEYYLRNQVLGDTESGPLLFIVGDSFVASIKGSDVVDYLYAALARHGVRIRNTAMPGTSPVEYLQNLRREGPRYRPAVVLLSYYVGNDLLDVGCRSDLDQRLRPKRSSSAWKRTYVAQFGKEWLLARFPGRVMFRSIVTGLPLWELMGPTLLRPFERASRSPALRLQEVDYHRLRRAGIPEKYIESAKAGKLNPWIVGLGSTNPNYYRDELLMRSECAQRAWEETKRILDMIIAEAAKLHAQVLPVIFPHSLQVSTEHYALYREWKINVDDEMLRANRPQQLLREYFRSRGLEPLDLLSAFRSQRARLYWDQDEHMNISGQQLAARLIAEAFLARYGQSGR